MAMAEIEPRAVIKSMKSTFTSVVGFGMCWRTQRNHLTEASERVDMEDKLIEACRLALEVGILILGGVVTGVLTIVIMSHVIDMSMPGKVMTFVCAVGTYGLICSVRRVLGE